MRIINKILKIVVGGNMDYNKYDKKLFGMTQPCGTKESFKKNTIQKKRIKKSKKK